MDFLHKILLDTSIYLFKYVLFKNACGYAPSIQGLCNKRDNKGLKNILQPTLYQFCNFLL